jgi:essential nuclear protein 1
MCTVRYALIEVKSRQEVNEEEEMAMAMFMRREGEPQRTLADIIMDKITEKQTELQSQFSESGGE